MNIFKAVLNGDLNAVKSFIKSSFNVEFKHLYLMDRHKMTLLHIAAKLGFAEIANILIEKCSNVNAKDE